MLTIDYRASSRMLCERSSQDGMASLFAILRHRLRWLLPYGHWDTRGVIMSVTDTSFAQGRIVQFHHRSQR